MSLAGPGRRYTAHRVVRSGDVLTSGRVRLDALARYLQDVAYDDGVDARIDPDLAWVVRRTTMRIADRPRHRDRLSLLTWAAAAGTRWAQRRTTVAARGRVAVEAAALWVCVDAATFRPARLSPRFWEVYGEATAGRTVPSRLVHDPPPADLGPGRCWPLRLSDFDLFGHVNNTATWMAVEDEMQRIAPAGRVDWVEVEYRAPIDRGTEVTIHSGLEGNKARVWLMEDATVLASAVAGVAADAQGPAG
jgi:acyl-ACP thioesterase